jgi:hypothetical protein
MRERFVEVPLTVLKLNNLQKCPIGRMKDAGKWKQTGTAAVGDIYAPSPAPRQFAMTAPMSPRAAPYSGGHMSVCISIKSIVGGIVTKGMGQYEGELEPSCRTLKVYHPTSPARLNPAISARCSHYRRPADWAVGLYAAVTANRSRHMSQAQRDRALTWTTSRRLIVSMWTTR